MIVSDSARGRQRFFTGGRGVRWELVVAPPARAVLMSKNNAKAELAGRRFSWQSGGSDCAWCRAAIDINVDAI